MSLEAIKDTQQGVYRIIKNGFLKERLAHAYLLEGPKGVGKLDAALEVVKAYFCNVKPKIGCDSCNVCRRVMNGTHPDVILIKPDGQHIKVEQIRQLKKQLSMSAVEGDRKVYIIQQADRMNVQAANSMLKFLEEPSKSILALLLTEKSSGVLETIRSRVQTITFKQPKVTDYIDLIMDKYSIDREVANLVGAFTSDLRKVEELVTDHWMQGAIAEIAHFMEQINLNSSMKFITVNHLMSYFETREQQQIALLMLSMWQRDILMISLNKADQVVFTNHMNELKGFSFRSENQDLLLQAQRKIHSNVSAQLVFEQLCYRLRA